jgi:RNA recognition motif-containing protein
MKNIFVGNLSFNASEGALRAMFEEFGTVGRVSIATDRDTGQQRGFAFVEMRVFRNWNGLRHHRNRDSETRY